MNYTIICTQSPQSKIDQHICRLCDALMDHQHTIKAVFLIGDATYHIQPTLKSALKTWCKQKHTPIKACSAACVARELLHIDSAQAHDDCIEISGLTELYEYQQSSDRTIYF